MISSFNMPMIGQMTEVHRQQGAQSQLTRYHVDVNGQMTQVACTGQHIDFRYDATGRLIEECLNGQAIAYEYDANGNRLKTRLPSGDSLGYFYYGSGHLSGIKLNSQLISEMERDELHREISRSQGRLNGRYYYDDMGRLVQQQAGLANQQNAVQIDRTYGYDELGHLIQTRTHCPQQPFEAPYQTQYQESKNAQHAVNYFHCDQIGVPREMTDSQGKLIWKGRYDAWGQLIHDSNRHA